MLGQAAAPKKPPAAAASPQPAKRTHAPSSQDAALSMVLPLRVHHRAPAEPLPVAETRPAKRERPAPGTTAAASGPAQASSSTPAQAVQDKPKSARLYRVEFHIAPQSALQPFSGAFSKLRISGAHVTIGGLAEHTFSKARALREWPSSMGDLTATDIAMTWRPASVEGRSQRSALAANTQVYEALLSMQNLPRSHPVSSCVQPPAPEDKEQLPTVAVEVCLASEVWKWA
jgi:hypothetical protein